MALALDAVKNRKKALAFAKRYLHQGTQLPSGKNIQDLLAHVNDSMWSLQSAKDKKDYSETTNMGIQWICCFSALCLPGTSQ